MTAQWATDPIHPEAWKTPGGPGMDYAAEQDEAAGGSSRRQISLPGGGTAMASIRLKCLPNSRRIYAYLRYSVAGKTVTKYVGDATAPTRPEALQKAWKLARKRSII